MNATDRKWLRSPSERVGTLAIADLPPPAAAPDPDEKYLLQALLNRDEAAVESILARYHPAMFRLARSYVRSDEEAEEVVQDTWLAVLGGLDRFEGRSSLKTWIFRILVNRARTRAKREARQIPFSALSRLHRPVGFDTDDAGPDMPLPGESDSALYWQGQPWSAPSPDEVLLAGELRERIEAAIRDLPTRQQSVVSLRDLEGWSGEEVCRLLEISEGHQRVLLHRGRSRLRDELRPYFAPRDAEEAADREMRV